MEEIAGESSTETGSPYSDRPIALSSTTARDQSGSSSVFASRPGQRFPSPPQMSSLQVTTSTHIHQSTESEDSIRNINVQSSATDVSASMRAPDAEHIVAVSNVNSDTTSTAVPAPLSTRTNSNSAVQTGVACTNHTVEPLTPPHLISMEKRDTTTPLQPSEQPRTHSFLSSAGLAVPLNHVIQQNSSNPLLTPNKFLDGSISNSTYLEHVEKGLKEKEKSIQILEQQLRLAKEEAKEALSRSVHGTEERGKMRKLISDQQDHIDQLDSALKNERSQLEQRTKEFEEGLRAHAKALEVKEKEVQEMKQNMKTLEEQMAIHRGELEKVKPLQEEYLKIKEALEEINEIRDAEHRHYDQIVREVVKEKRQHQRAALEAQEEKKNAEERHLAHASLQESSDMDRKKGRKRKKKKRSKHHTNLETSSKESEDRSSESDRGHSKKAKKKGEHGKHISRRKGGYHSSSSDSSDREQRRRGHKYSRKEQRRWKRNEGCTENTYYEDDDYDEEDEEEETECGWNANADVQACAGGVVGMSASPQTLMSSPYALPFTNGLPALTSGSQCLQGTGGYYSGYLNMGGIPQQAYHAQQRGTGTSVQTSQSASPPFSFLPPVCAPAASLCHRRHVSSCSSSSSSSSSSSESSKALLLAIQKQKYQQQLEEKARESKQALLQRRIQLEFIEKAADIEAKDQAHRVAEAKKALLEARHQLLEAQRIRKEEELRGKKMLTDLSMRHSESRFALEKQEEQLRNKRFQFRLAQARSQRESELMEDQKHYELDTAVGKYTRELSHLHQEIVIEQKQVQRRHMEAERRLRLMKDDLKRQDEQSEFLLQRLHEAMSRRKQNSAVWGTQLQQVVDRSKRENEDLLQALRDESKEVEGLI